MKMWYFFIYIVYCLYVTDGLVLRHHNGKLIKGHDLGPIRHQHHVTKILSETLYQTREGIDLYSSVAIDVNAATDPLILPINYGADPTGKIDSTFAFQQAIKVALARGDISNNSLSDGIKDCGGATIFLGGGDYLISESLIIPPYYGNIRITDGTIRANTNFSKNDYMIRIGATEESACTTKQKSCNEYINIDHFFCDGKNIAYGCIHIISGMSSNVGPQAFFLGYNYAGITATGGHSLFLLNSWFGEYLYSDPRKGKYNDSTATSINLNNPDNLINDVIVYSSRVGVNITGPATSLINVHTWNLATKQGGIGIILSSHARFVNCYMDYNDLILITPISMVSVENTFFLGSGTLRLKAAKGNGIIDSLSVFDSQYSGGNGTVDTIVLDESEGTFKTGGIRNVFIKDTLINGGYIEKSTRASKKLSQIMSTQWIFDFTNELLFGQANIEWADYTFQFDVDKGGQNYKDQIIHWMNVPNNKTVIIETNQATNATVYVTVDQSNNFVY